MRKGKNLVVLIREELGLSQYALAERVGCYQSDISNFERGERPLSAGQCLSWWGKLRPELKSMGIGLEDLLRFGRE